MRASLTYLFHSGDPHFERCKNNKSYQFSRVNEVYIFFHNVSTSLKKLP